MKESLKQWKQRKKIFIQRATKHFDTPRIRREAAELFDYKNNIKLEKC